jgi:hypothetical protein
MLLCLHKAGTRTFAPHCWKNVWFAVLAQGVSAAFLQKEEKHEKNNVTHYAHYMDGKYKGNLVAHF